jgi:hypothetical protein
MTRLSGEKTVLSKGSEAKIEPLRPPCSRQSHCRADSERMSDTQAWLGRVGLHCINLRHASVKSRGLGTQSRPAKCAVSQKNAYLFVYPFDQELGGQRKTG